MKVLVVGGLGNIGSAVTALFAEKIGEENVYIASSVGLIYNGSGKTIRATPTPDGPQLMSAVDGSPYDFIIDCNGRPSRREAHHSPRDFFWKNLVSLLMWSGGVPHTNYIYISSCYANAYPQEWVQCLPLQLEPYGRTKLISEQILQELEPHLLILRPALVIGKRMKKGVVYDLITDSRAYVTPYSTFNIITARGLADIIYQAVMEWHLWDGKKYNVGSQDVIWAKDIADVLGIENAVFGDETETTEFCTTKLEKDRGIYLGTARDNLLDFKAKDWPLITKREEERNEGMEKSIQPV